MVEVLIVVIAVIAIWAVVVIKNKSCGHDDDLNIYRRKIVNHGHSRTKKRCHSQNANMRKCKFTDDEIDFLKKR